MEEEEKFSLISPDWKKEFDKYMLTKKYSEATAQIGLCASEPTLENIKIAYGMVTDFISYIPTAGGKAKEIQDDLLRRLDEIGLIIHSNPATIPQELLDNYGLILAEEREGLRIVKTLQNLPNLVIALRDLLIDAGNFAVSLGLRITLAQERKFGLRRILEEEGIDLSEL